MLSDIHHFFYTPRARIALIIITITGFLCGLSFYGIFFYETVVIGDLIKPNGLWFGCGLLGVIIMGLIWMTYATLTANIMHRPIAEMLYEDAFSYLPAVCLIGVWLKHMGFMSSFAYIFAFSGVISWKIWNLDLRRSVWPTKWWGILLGILIVVYIFTFSMFSGIRVHTFQTYGDFATMIQPIWGFGRLQSLFMTSLGNSFFGAHFWLTLVLLGPLYRLFEHPITLTVLHTMALGIGALPVFLIARQHLRIPMLAFVFAAAYLLYPAIQLPNLSDFHETLLVPPLFLFVMYYLDQRKYWLSALFALLAIGCKEDMSIPITLIGMYTFFHKQTRLYGLFLTTFGILWFVVIIFVVMPMFGHIDPLLYVTASPLTDGQNPDLIDKLSDIVNQVLTISKVSTIPHLLLPLGFLSLAGYLEAMLWGGPLLVIMLYTGPPYGLVGTIYSWHITTVVPFVFYAAIKGTHWVIAQLRKYDESTNQIRSITTICVFILICSIGANATYGAVPFGFRFNWQSYQVTNHVRVGHDILSRIPDDPDIPVSATGALIPYLSHRKTIYPFPYPFIKRAFYSKTHDAIQPTYVIMDTSAVAINRMLLEHQEGFMKAARMVIQHPDYQVFESRDGFVLLQRYPDGAEGQR